MFHPYPPLHRRGEWVELRSDQLSHLPLPARTRGNISRAAEALGLERSHLYRKMKALDIHLGE